MVSQSATLESNNQTPEHADLNLAGTRVYF